VPCAGGQVEFHGWNIPIHCIGVECNTAGRRMLEAVAEMTDGSFTPYEWDGRAHTPQPVEDFVAMALRDARRANMAAGRLDEALPVTMARVRKDFFSEHITAVEAQNQSLKAQAERYVYSVVVGIPSAIRRRRMHVGS
jgi:hypothetical protein